MLQRADLAQFDIRHAIEHSLTQMILIEDPDPDATQAF